MTKKVLDKYNTDVPDVDMAELDSLSLGAVGQELSHRLENIDKKSLEIFILIHTKYYKKQSRYTIKWK